MIISFTAIYNPETENSTLVGAHDAHQDQ